MSVEQIHPNAEDTKIVAAHATDDMRPATDNDDEEGTPTEPLSSYAQDDSANDDSTENSEQQERGLGEIWEGDTQELSPASVPLSLTRHLQQGFAAEALRDIGKVREVNQDSIFSLITTLPRGSVDQTVGLFIVADGMGGHEEGEVASNLTIRSIVDYLFAHFFLPTLNDDMTEAMQTLMVSAVEKANHVVWEHAQQSGTDMGTTCTAALLTGKALSIAHVGDSRAYLMQDGSMLPLTADHSPVGRLIELGQLEPSAAREHPLRNQLYRAIGQDQNVDVDFIYQPLGNSTHIILCSDGLWGPVLEDDIVDVLNNTTWPKEACQKLIDMANRNGGEDNISVVVVTLSIEEHLSDDQEAT